MTQDVTLASVVLAALLTIIATSAIITRVWLRPWSDVRNAVAPSPMTVGGIARPLTEKSVATSITESIGGAVRRRRWLPCVGCLGLHRIGLYRGK